MTMKKNSILCIFMLLIIFQVCPENVLAFSSMNVKVEIIKATKKSNIIDPQLKDLANEIAPVLNYTGFKLAKKSEQKLTFGQTSEILLSSKRILKLTFKGFEENQGRLLVEIMEKKKKVFHTILLLVDKGFVLIGGPLYEDGVLLLRVGAEFD
ncbi:MAG: hypothetical protein HOJ48_13640 [Desulfobacula sp.]|jgi:hypothetical protein|nr:hypothetical protein [Deltaproteobacteria bacterium]MBT6340329.1 hypothetical protein [Desulfobacula sp.]